MINEMDCELSIWRNLFRIQTFRTEDDASWMAKITGTDPRYRLKREFCKRFTEDRPVGAVPDQTFVGLVPDHLYQFKNIARYRRGFGATSSGFFQIINNEIEYLDWRDAYRIAEQYDDTTNNNGDLQIIWQN